MSLTPILAVVRISIARLERQLPAFAGDAKKTEALRRSIVTLKSVYAETNAICPNEIKWFGVPVRDRR